MRCDSPVEICIFVANPSRSSRSTGGQASDGRSKCEKYFSKANTELASIYTGLIPADLAATVTTTNTSCSLVNALIVRFCVLQSGRPVAAY